MAPHQQEHVLSQRAIDAMVRSAGRSLLLVSGGERAGDDSMLERARQSMEASATWLIFGRNACQRGRSELLCFAGHSARDSRHMPSG